MAGMSFQAPTDFTAEAEDIARRRKYAEMLQAQSIEPLAAPPTPSGGFAVPISPMAGLAKMLQAYTGARGQADANAQQRALGQRYKTEQADLVNKAFQAGEGSPAIQNEGTEFAPGWTTPAQAPNLALMARLLQSSDDPTHKAFGMQTMQQEMARKRLAGMLPGGSTQTTAPPAGVAPQDGMPAPAVPVGVSPTAPTGGVPPGIDPLAWKLMIDKGDQAAIAKVLQEVHADANKPTDLQRNLGFVGIAKDSPEARNLVLDPSSRLAAQNASLVEYTIPGTDRKVKIPNNIANVLSTGVAPDAKTLEIAKSVANQIGMNVNIGLNAPAGAQSAAAPIPVQPAQQPASPGRIPVRPAGTSSPASFPKESPAQRGTAMGGRVAALERELAVQGANPDPELIEELRRARGGQGVLPPPNAPRVPLGDSEKAGMEEAAKGSVKHVATDLNESLAGAQNALKRHTTLEQMHTAIASGKAITGPGATPATWFQRVGEAAFGPGNKKSVVETQQLVQGLADLALSGAAAMRGQGAITENERFLLMKAKSGVQNLLPDELNALLTIFDKQNRFEIQQHNERYGRAEKIKYPNLEYWGRVAEPPKLGGAKVGVSLSPEAIKFMQDNGIAVPGR